MNGMWKALAGEVLQGTLTEWQILWCGEVLISRHGIHHVLKRTGRNVLAEFIELPRMELPE